MGFFDSLNANPGGSGVYGQPGAVTGNDGIDFNQLQRVHDMNNNDFENRANFMANLSMRQNNLRNVFNPSPSGAPVGDNGQPMNTVFKDNNPDLTDREKAGIQLGSQEIANRNNQTQIQNKMGQERLDIQSKAEKLNEQKNQNIYDTKQADLQRKTDEANANLDLANRRLKEKSDDADRLDKYHKAQFDAATAQKDLVNHQHDAQIADMQKRHQAEMDALKQRTANAGKSKTKTTKIGDNGNSKTETTSLDDNSDNSDDNDPLGIR